MRMICEKTYSSVLVLGKKGKIVKLRKERFKVTII